MLGTLMDIAGREDREFGEEGRELLSGGDRHFEIAGGDRFEFRTLRDEGRIVVRLVRGKSFDRRAEDVGERNRALVRLGSRRRHPDRDLVLSESEAGAEGRCAGKREAAGQKQATSDGH